MKKLLLSTSCACTLFLRGHGHVPILRSATYSLRTPLTEVVLAPDQPSPIPASIVT